MLEFRKKYFIISHDLRFIETEFSQISDFDQESSVTIPAINLSSPSSDLSIDSEEYSIYKEIIIEKPPNNHVLSIYNLYINNDPISLIDIMSRPNHQF